MMGSDFASVRAVPISPTLWRWDGHVWVSLTADEIVEALRPGDRMVVESLWEIARDSKWTIEFQVPSGGRYRLTWGSPEPDPPGIDR
jgi:hypothetical protein